MMYCVVLLYAVMRYDLFFSTLLKTIINTRVNLSLLQSQPIHFYWYHLCIDQPPIFLIYSHPPITPLFNYLFCLFFIPKGLRIALAVDSNIFFANIRPSYTWAYLMNSVVMSHGSGGERSR